MSDTTVRSDEQHETTFQKYIPHVVVAMPLVIIAATGITLAL
ncbi:MAG: hypothetical protein Q4Q03_03085 [Bowdeniella nasicola]|nr:hypothetical protein [Bowdeniella nasicola]